MEGESLDTASTADMEMDVVEIEKEPAAVTTVVTILVDAVEEVIYEDEADVTEVTAVAAIAPVAEVADVVVVEDVESTESTTKTHGIWCRIFAVLAIVLAFILICIAIIYQVEWNKQRLLSQIPPGRSRFNEAVAVTSVETRLTTSTPAVTTTTEYLPMEYYEYLDESASEGDEYDDKEYDDNEYSDDAPYKFFYEHQESAENVLKTTTTIATLQPEEEVTFNVDTDISEIQAKLQKWSNCSIKRNFKLWPLNSEPSAGDVSTSHNLNALCLQCICETTSECSKSSRNGAFFISRNYWIDAGYPEVNTNGYGQHYTDYEKFNNCIVDPCCAAEAVGNFIRKYARDCNNDGKIDCRDHTMLHVLGPTRCMREKMSTVHEFRYDMCMGAHSLGL